MRVLAIGDVCGRSGVDYCCRMLPILQRELAIDFTIVNGENASVFGISQKQAETLWRAGADVITLGNHTYSKREIGTLLDESDRIIRPANLNAMLPGQGMTFVDTMFGEVCVLNLIGRCGMDFSPDNPFPVASRMVTEARRRTSYIFVDFHAEATSEKGAMAWHLDGQVSAVFGTHTHVQTADERIYPRGTGFLTDLGMTGPRESVIGVCPEQSLGFFRGDTLVHYTSAEGPCLLNGAGFEVDEDGACTDIGRVCEWE